MELINVLGIDWKILIAQLVNFAILFFVLNKFGFKPMIKFLEERSGKIEKGIDDAKKAEERLIEISEKEKEILNNAKKEVKKMMDATKIEAEEKRKETIEKTKNEIGVLINTEKEKIKQEKAELLKEIRSEVGSLVLMSLEKILEEKIDDKKDKELIEKIVNKISK